MFEWNFSQFFFEKNEKIRKITGLKDFKFVFKIKK